MHRQYIHVVNRSIIALPTPGPCNLCTHQLLKMKLSEAHCMSTTLSLKLFDKARTCRNHLAFLAQMRSTVELPLRKRIA
jgi:hypothetical protein